MADLSSYLRDVLLNHVFHGAAFTQPSVIYVSVHNGDPGLTGANEASGNAYARQNASAVFAAASGGSKTTNVQVVFDSMPAGTWTYAGVWDALSGGNFLWRMLLTTPEATVAGDTLRFAPGNITALLS